jgi:predicted SAM-dependent methyltransferase
LTEAVYINLGSGHWKFDGWVNVDLDLASRPDVCADLAAGLPFRDASAELMHSEDFIDQLDLDGARRLLLECHRILKPGGVLRILTPDLAELARLYVQEPDRLVEMWKRHVGVPLHTGSAGEVFNLGMRFAGHTFLYDAETFMRLLEECGFEARQQSFNHSDIPQLRRLDLRGPDNSISMYFDCYRLSS